MIVVIAEKEELKLVEELGYSNYPVLITGVGGINVINALKDIPRDTEILNIGYAGSNYFEVSTVVHIEKVKTNHEIAKFNEEYQRLKIENINSTLSKCYTSTDFVTKTKKTDYCVFDMELAFIRALFPNTRAIKVVSDNLNKKQYKKTTN